MFRPNGTKHKLAAGKPAFGLLSGLASPLVTELAGLAGYDWILLDGEHGPGDHAALLACLQAAAATGMTAITRVAANDPVLLKRVLDLGVEGVVIPDVRNAEEASAAVAACRYPPRGRRGFAAGMIRAADYGLATAEYVAGQAEELLVVALIESEEGAANAAAIAAIEGIDVIQAGPNDLSGDLGILGRFEHPRYLEAVAAIEAGARAAGKPMGGGAYPGMSLPEAMRRGYLLISAAVDVGLLRDALVGQLKSLKG